MYFIILAVITVIILIVAAKSNMLRNQVFNESNFCGIAANKSIKTPKPAFSLGRSQLAFWTVIIVSSFIYVYLSTSPQEFMSPVLAEVNLTLLGIAAGTTVVSKVIDNSQNDNPGAGVPQQDFPSKSFLTDIISDEKGVSIHRLQNVIWTFVVGGIYISYVYARCHIPDDKVITPQLLMLMGISSGAYLGLKTTENTSAPVNQDTKAPPVVNNPPAVQPDANAPDAGGPK